MRAQGPNTSFLKDKFLVSEKGVVSYFLYNFEGYIRRNGYVFNKYYWEAMKNEKKIYLVAINARV